jgi:zinc protease
MSSKSHVVKRELHGVPILVEQSLALPLVSLTVARRGGALCDPIGCEGASRLLSRLSRRTAGGRPFQAIEEELDRLGATFGTDVTYSSVSLSGVSIARSIDNFGELVADAAGKPSLDVEEFERLKRESRAEIIEGLDNDRALAGRALRRALYPTHPYARSASGTLASVEQMSHAGMLEFDRLTRGRNGLVIGLSGDIDVERAMRLAERIILAIPDQPGTAPSFADPEVPSGRQLIIVDKPERAQTQILIGLSGTKPTDPDHTALSVAMTVFGGTFSSRLMQQIRVKRGWSYGAYATLPIDQHRQPLTLWTFPGKADAAACTKLKVDLLETLVEKGITAKELSFAKKSMVRSHAFSIDTAAKRLGLALDGELLDLPANFYTDFERRVSAVTLAETSAALHARIDPKRLVIAVVGSAEELRDQILAAIPDITSVNVIPYDSPDL